ncbi:CD9 antigen [Hyalella azteca]|uniref:Tetraspanin n=1 Tax=Hyalella azteca TaxID=294128 RepID=A0A8B7N1R7_HYAAZ|nr:CD9 antigen [Hyalella azteca]
MGGCCYSCLKFLVIIFNLIYMLLGLALLGTTLWIYLDDTMLAPVGAADMEGYNHVIYFLMVVAAIMTVMGFIGCCGALQESQCMLATFFALVLVLFIGKIAAGTWIYQNQDQFAKVLEKSVARSIQHDYGKIDVRTKAFDLLQSKLQCCGASGPSDWAESRYNQADDKSALEIGIGKVIGVYKVPESCCKSTVTQDDCETKRQVSLAATFLDRDIIYSTGCASKIMELVQQHDYIVLAVVLAILLIEAMAMIFSMVLCCAVRRIDHFKA